MQRLDLSKNSLIKVINGNEESYELYFNYNMTRQGWFVDLISDKITIRGIRLTSCPNILDCYSDRIGFGLSVISENYSEPFFYEDFASQRCNLYLLEPSDLQALKKL